jgi:hypothetical protein
MNGILNGSYNSRPASHGAGLGNGFHASNEGAPAADAPAEWAPGAQRMQDAAADLLSQELGESAWVSQERPGAGGLGSDAKRLTAQLNLVVGIGGTGVKVATQLKARFAESLGAIPRNVALVALDGANDPIALREGRNGAIVTLEWGSERHQLDSVPAANIVKYLEQHPAIADRFGREQLLKMRNYIVDGAAGERPQGALTLIWNAPRLMTLIGNALRRLAERTKDLQQVMDGNVILRVYVAGSVAGGMGAGALLDLAYIIREELRRLGDLGESSEVHAMLLLPDAFYGIEHPRNQANAYATLREINALMLGEAAFHSGYPNGQRIDSSLPPFTDVALYGGVNEHGRTWRSQDEIVALMAETLWLRTSSEVGSQEINHKINEAGVLNELSPGGFVTCATTSGAVVLRFPARTAAVWCALRHAAQMIAGLLAADAAALPEPVVRDLATLRDRALSNDEGVPHQVRLVAPAALLDLPTEELPGQTRNLFENFMQRRLYDDIFAQMKQRVEEQVTAYLATLASEQAARLETGRLHATQRWLEANRRTLGDLLAAVDAEQSRLGQLAEQQQAALESASLALEHAGRGLMAYLPIVGRGQARTAVNVYLDEATALARLRLTQRVEELCAEALHRLAAWVQQQQRQLDLVAARLEQTREWLAAYETALARRSSGRSELSLLDAALIDDFYRRCAGSPQSAAQLALTQSGGLLAWAAPTPEQLGRLLVQSALGSFDKIAQMSVEEVLRLRFPDRSAAQWVTMFQALAAGAWNLDRALLRSGGATLARILTIGVPDEGRSIFQACGHGLVSTHDPERIVVLLTVYGASFDALKAFSQWEAAYRQQSSGRLVHVLPHFLRNGDQATRVFGLGLAFELIQMTGAWYYYRPEDPLADKVRLGQGLESAVRTLAVSPAVQEQVMRRVEAQIAAQGREAAVKRLQSWIDRGGVNGDEMLKRLRLAVRQYGETDLGVELQAKTERGRA